MTSTTMKSATRRPEDDVHSGWLWAARLLMVLVGAQLLAGATYFTFFAGPEEGGVETAFDWFVAVWALASAVALLLVATLPFPSPASRLSVAWWVMGAHFIWTLVKLLAYDELPVSAIVSLIDLVVLAVLWLAARGRSRAVASDAP